MSDKPHSLADNNLLVKANEGTPGCSRACVNKLLAIRAGETLVVSKKIIYEYMKTFSEQAPSDEQGVGTEFYLWVLQNEDNPECCLKVETPTERRAGLNTFAHFPKDRHLDGFHDNDHKFVAAAIAAAPTKPTIYNATDRDWADYYRWLKKYVRIKCICPNIVKCG